MISIIISTYRNNFLKNLTDNIKETIGKNIQYEIIPIYNEGKYSISEAYNIGGNKAKFPFLCFLHEDVLFETKNWGEILIKIFKNNDKIALIGLVGAKILSQNSLDWYDNTGRGKFLIGNIIQGQNSWIRKKYINFSNNTKKDGGEAVVIDGVFMCVRAEIFKKITFSQSRVKSFHGYDLDYCLKILNYNHKIWVTEKITLFHYSLGSINKNWFTTKKGVLVFWSNLLPAITSDTKFNKRDILESEVRNFLKYLKYKIKFNILNKK